MAINVVPLCVTPDDFKNFFGQDLRYLLAGASDNDSNYPNLFLRMVQDFLIDWCDENSFRRYKFSELNPMQYEAFQKAVLYQAYYTWKNGMVALGLESGYDSERGTNITETDLQRVGVPQRVVMLLHKSGLFNLNVKNKPRITKGYPWTGPMGDYY